MTMRQVGETAIKILGVYYAASAVFALGGVLASLLLPREEGWPSASDLAAMNMVGVLVDAAVAVAFMWRGGAIAAAIFSGERLSVSGLSRRDCLFVGISLVGLTWVLTGAPAIVQAIGKGIWYAEASRQALFLDAMRHSSADLVNAGVSILIGVAVLLLARTLSRRLDPEAPRRD